MKGAARRYLIYSHRYLGIALGLMLVMWFASGIVMLYVGGMPRLGPELRLARLPPLELSRVRLTPGEAARRLNAQVDVDHGTQVSLLTVLGRPAYRFTGSAFGTVFADDGQLLGDIDVAAAGAIASRFAGVAPQQLRFERRLARPDQWTLGQQGLMPLHEFRLDDADGTRLYVSPAIAEVVQLTTRRTRALAWAGAIPHWLYFAALRSNQPLWYRTVVWLSATCCLLAVLGLALAFTQFRRTRPFRLALAIPYTRWLRWHYIGGSLFGLFALTWAFSGMLSMEPFDWSSTRALQISRDVFTGGRTDLARFGAFDTAALQKAVGNAVIKEIGFSRIQDEYYYRLHAVPAAGERSALLRQSYLLSIRREEPPAVLVKTTTLQPLTSPFSTASIIARLTAAVPDAPIVEQQLLEHYDSYYYSRDRARPLPVLRIKFGDAAQTWVYVDPHTSSLLAQLQRYGRLERWLYKGLHSLDFAFWYDKRPWWDLGMIALLLGGMFTSAVGTYLGIRRLIAGRF